MPNRALLNDINPHLLNFYRWLQVGLRIDGPLRYSRTTYLRSRQRFNELVATGRGNSAEAASLFYYLNRTGYNGLCRFNRSGRFNVPFGKYERIAYRTTFPEYQRVFEDWIFTNADFECIRLRPSDFVYADPPYDVEFTSYSAGGFKWDDQVRLADWLTRHRGPVVLSNQATARIVDLYRARGFTLHFLRAPRRISCDGNRTPAQEVLAIRNI